MRALGLLGLLAGLWIALGALPWAQDGQLEEAPAVQPAAPAELESPQAAIGHFLRSMQEDDVEAAARIFDLSHVPSIELAVQRQRTCDFLRGILDRIEVVKLREWPALGDPVLESGVWVKEYYLFKGFVPFPVRLRFERGADGGWRLGRGVVDGLEGAWEFARELPIVEELRDQVRPWRQELREWRTRWIPDGLQERGFLVEHWQWIGLALLVFVAVVVDQLVRQLTRRVTQRVVGRVRVSIETDLRAFVRPMGLWGGALAFRLLLQFLDLPETYHGSLELAAAFIIAVGGVWSAYRLVDVVTRVLEDRASQSSNKFDDVLVPMLRRTLKIFVVIIGVFYFASWWTEDLWRVMAGVGVGTFALTFAAKDSIENLFGTFTVLLDKPFQLGDWILVEGIEGTVEQVGFRSTRIRTFYNSVITLPNSKFISSSVDNMGARRYRRVKTTLALTYDTPPEKLDAFCEGIRELLRTHPYTRKDYYHVYFNGFGASSLDVLLYAFLECPDWATELREKHRLYADILRIAESIGVGFAFPSQSLYMVRPEDLEHADRPDDIEDGLRRGREAARSAVERSLEGLPPQGPPPPAFDGPDPDWRLGSDV